MKYIIANWKMNMSKADVANWISRFNQALEENVVVIIAPSTPYLSMVRENNLLCASQDVSLQTKGAYTGETGSFQVKDYCKYSIVGHSERHEDLETVKTKISALTKEGITPIICFTNLENAKKLYTENALMAWEDPKNISSNGTYKEPSMGMIKAQIQEIKAALPDNTVLLYGGSVNKDNCVALAEIEEISGVLVGNASLDVNHFEDIIRSFSKQ